MQGQRSKDVGDKQEREILTWDSSTRQDGTHLKIPSDFLGLKHLSTTLWALGQGFLDINISTLTQLSREFAEGSNRHQVRNRVQHNTIEQQTNHRAVYRILLNVFTPKMLYNYHVQVQGGKDIRITRNSGSALEMIPLV